ncbi:MAG: dihydroorotase, partial [Solirubrobacteraceae bacterium]|nr:dihydroorotase [Solirubrobacteraceae bacterium]
MSPAFVRAGDRGGQPRLVRAPARTAALLVRGVHVLDPRTGLDGPHDVLVREGEIAEIGAPGKLASSGELETIDGTGRHLFPAFVDPHVHLRTPGQEHKEDLETGTRSAAAGGYCAIVAMPNTSPVVDSGPILGALLDAAAREARVPVGFMAAITRGEAGRELTEMAELRALGAAAFTDDGRPVVDAGVFRRALQYQRLCGGVLALHEEDPALSGNGAMHEGAISTLLGVAGIPSVSESTMIARDCALAEYEDARIHIQHLSARESVDVVAGARARGVQVTCEVSPHHLTMTDEDVRGLDTRRKMNPPLR